MIKKILYIVGKEERKNIFFLAVLMMLGAGMELISVSILLPLVNVVTDTDIIIREDKYRLLGEAFHLQETRDYVIFLAIAIAIIYVLKNVFLIWENDIQFRYIFNTKRKLSSKLLSVYLSQDYLFFTENSIPELQRNVMQDVGTTFYVLQNIINLMTEIIVGISLISYLLSVDVKTTLVIGCVAGFFSVIFLILHKKINTKQGEIFREAVAKSNKWLLQSFEGIKEIKVMHKEKFFWKNYDDAARVSAQSDRITHVLTYMPKPVLETFVIAGLMLVIGVRVFLGSDVESFIPILTAFVVAAYRMLPAFNRITSCYGWIVYGKSAVDNVYKDVQRIESFVTEEKTEDNKYVFNNIEINNISFKYPQGEENIIENVSFKIPQNKSVAFVGKSGAGKTTLADLVLGILEPSSGDIQVSGRSIFESQSGWQKNIGYIPQVIYLMDDSIRNNIAFGVEKNEIDDEMVWKALKEAQLDEFVRELPEQLDTEVGDRGVRLSGGQRQRIGIARAIYRNPEFLVFDEATSALDNETEKAVMESIKALHGKRTILIIAHRLSTIKECDAIFKVEDKKVERVEYSEISNKKEE